MKESGRSKRDGGRKGGSGVIIVTRLPEESLSFLYLRVPFTYISKRRRSPKYKSIFDIFCSVSSSACTFLVLIFLKASKEGLLGSPTAAPLSTN